MSSHSFDITNIPLTLKTNRVPFKPHSFSNDNFNCNNSLFLDSRYICLQNIRSLRTNYDQFVTHLNAMHNKPLLCFLTEIWINSNEKNNYNIDDYIFEANCNDVNRSTGVAVYMHRSVSVNEIICHNLSTADCLQVNILVNGISISFLCVYRFHFIVQLHKFLDEIKILLSSITDRNLFVLGDFNINLLNMDNSTNEYLTLMASFGLESLINAPTRIVGNHSTCIDHIFCRSASTSNLIISASNSKVMCDHNLLIIKLLFKSSTKPLRHNPIKKSSIDYESVNKFLANESWSSVYVCDEPNAACEIFNRIIKDILIRSTKVNNVISKHIKPWMNNSLLLLCKKKQKVGKQLQKHPNSMKLCRYFQNLCSKFKAAVKQTKINYYKYNFALHWGDSKAQWRFVDSLLNLGGNKHDIKEIMTTNNTIVTNDKDICNEFNNFFLEIPHKLTRASTSRSVDVDHNFVTTFHSCSSNSFFLHPTNRTEILNAICDLKGKHSVDVDGLSNFFIKKTKHHICDVLSHIINLSFSTGIFPDIYKSAVVIPIHKRGSLNDANNYRPISLISTISKILEVIVKKRMLMFLGKVKFLSSNQFGFMPGRSTEDALIKLNNFIHCNINCNKKVAALFIDITKAFDTVNHKVLLHKLSNIGFRGVALEWFQSYLANRRQRVKINDSFSCEGIVNIGVPQGSVLGPLLFLIYINSIFSIGLLGKLTAFADDTVILYSAASYLEIERLILADLCLLRKWFDFHYMVLSNKTKLMFFSASIEYNPVHDFIFHSSNCTTAACNGSSCFKIDHVQNFKYLGVNISSNCSWKLHTSLIHKDILNSIRKLYLLRSFCPPAVLQIYYHAMVQSRIQYGIVCWGSTYFSNIKNIVTGLKHCLRIIHSKCRLSPSFPLFCKSNILQFRNLYVFKVLKLFFKRSGNLNIKVTDYNLRHSNICLTPAVKLEFVRRSFMYMAPYLYNRIPPYIKCETNIKWRLNCLKSWLINIKNIEYLLSSR